MNRRDFLKALGIAGTAIVVPELVIEPRRKMWFVPRNYGEPLYARLSDLQRTDVLIGLLTEDLLTPEEARMIALWDSMSDRRIRFPTMIRTRVQVPG